MPFDLDRQTLRDAFRLGMQSAVAAVACYTIIQMIGSDEAFVAVLSAVLIVQPSIGRTISAGWERLLATLVGSGIGLACLFLLPGGYGVGIALAVVMFTMNFVAGFRSNWRYGVVAAVALALADTSGDVDVAQARAVAIGIGIAVGIAVSLIVWPESAVKRGRRHRRNALDAVAKRYAAALRDEKDGDGADAARRAFHGALSSGREVIGKAKTSDPKGLHSTFDALEELYNSVILIDRVDSPLSYFDEAAIDRSDLVDAGQAAIRALTDDGADEQAGMEDFSQAVDAVEEGLKGRDIQDDSTQHAGSVVFGLREMERCMKDFHMRERKRDKGGKLAQALPGLG
ncbi:FUSC family protein [uncultured Algimonas sp.]|uniref:FUSC family protein n=1 Tax=uncultured Algimonas sp. TaxID=1547920 RepID=UPI0026247441|nr:FUSC family protein [uncultured Algimonas sp.]